MEEVDVTSFFTSDDYRAFKPGLKDPGEMIVSGKLDLDDPGVRAILLDSGATPSAVDTYTVEFDAAGDVVYSCTAYPRPINLGAGVGEADTMEITFKLTGKPTLLDGAAALF